jgi:hypothetical protein
MECDQPGLLADGQVHGGDVAVAQKDFRVPANQFVVDSVEQMTAAVTAADGEHGLHFGVAEHPVQVGQSLFDGARHVPGAPSYVRPELGAQPEVLDGAAGEDEAVGVRDIGCRSDEPDRVSRPQRLRLDRSGGSHAPCRRHAERGADELSTPHESRYRISRISFSFTLAALSSFCMLPSVIF